MQHCENGLRSYATSHQRAGGPEEECAAAACRVEDAREATDPPDIYCLRHQARDELWRREPCTASLALISREAGLVGRTEVLGPHGCERLAWSGEPAAQRRTGRTGGELLG